MFSKAFSTISATLSRVTTRAEEEAAILAALAPDLRAIVDEVWEVTHNVTLNVGHLDFDGRIEQARALLLVRQEQGEAEYRRRINEIVRWGAGVILENSLERDTGDVIRAVAASVAPVLLGPVAGAAVQSALMGGGLEGAAGAAVGAVLAAIPMEAPPPSQAQPMPPTVQPVAPVMAPAAPAPAPVMAPARLPVRPRATYQPPQVFPPQSTGLRALWGQAFGVTAWLGFY